LWFQSRWEMVPEVLSSLFLALVFGGSGFWYRRHEERQMSDREALRLLVLVVGGLVGFIIALYGIRLAIKWWATVTGGVEAWQGPEGWRVWVCVLVELAGLAIMFASLLLARTEERSKPLLRRLLYGFNAVLTGLLLLALLVVLNILAYIYLPTASDWTSSGL